MFVVSLEFFVSITFFTFVCNTFIKDINYVRQRINNTSLTCVFLVCVSFCAEGVDCWV